MLNEGGICDLNEDYTIPPEKQKIEIFCNHVAGAALIPKQELLNEDIVIRKTDKNSWTDDELYTLAKQFKVSEEVVLRLLICGLTTNSFYKNKCHEFRKSYELISKEPRDGFPPPDTLVISRAGRAFVKLVLDSYYLTILA